MSKELEVGDVILRVNVARHTNKPDVITYEQTIDRVTKLYAFGGTWKFKRLPEYKNSYERIGAVDSHFVEYKLKIE